MSMIVKRRKSYSPDEKLAALADWRSSGDYAGTTAKHGLWKSALHVWARKEGRIKARAAAAQKEVAKGNGKATTNVPAVTAAVGRNGRYTEEAKARTVQMITTRTMSLPKISETTGIHISTLYAWKKEVEAGGARAVVPAQAVVGDAPSASIQRIDVHEGLANLTKAKRELMAAIRSGEVTDLDNFHLRALLALNMLVGRK